MNDNLYPLRAFWMTAQEGQVTRAAERLGISQPAVSAHLKSLEQHFGERLFLREARGLKLTPFGETVLAQTRSIFQQLDALGRPGETTLAASTTPGAHWLPIRLRNFAGQVSYTIADSAEVERRILDHRVHFGIVGDRATRADLVYLEVASDQLQLFRGTQPQISEDVLVLREPGSSTRTHSLTLLEPLMPGFRRTLELGNNEALKEAVIAGLGVGVLSSWSVHREVAAGLLQPVQPERWCLQRPIYLSRRRDRQLQNKARELWDFLSQASEKSRKIPQSAEPEQVSSSRCNSDSSSSKIVLRSPTT